MFWPSQSHPLSLQTLLYPPASEAQCSGCHRGFKDQFRRSSSKLLLFQFMKKKKKQTCERKLLERMQKDKKNKVMDKVRSVKRDRQLLAQEFQKEALMWKNV